MALFGGSGGFNSLRTSENKTLIFEGKATRGKHAGRTYEWILSHHPGYLVWLAENTQDHGLLPNEIKTAKLAEEQKKESDDDDRRERSYDDQVKGFWDK